MLALLLSWVLFQGTSWQVDLEPLEMVTTYDMLWGYNLIAVADDGVVVLADAEASRCHIISPTGKVIAGFGRKGDGPGEFRGTILPFWANGSFWVLEEAQQRISRWRPNGTLLDTIKLSHPIHEGVLLEDTSLLSSLDILGTVGSSPGVASIPLKEGDKRILWRKEPLREASGYHQDGEHLTTVWDPSLKIAGNGNLVAAIYTTEKRVYLIDRQHGRLLREINLPIPSVPLSQQAYDLFIEELPVDIRAQFRQKLSRPTYWPKVNKISIDDQHRIWVASYQKSRDAQTPLYICNGQGKILMRTNIAGVFQTQKHNAAYAIEAAGDDLRLIKTVIPFKN